ncbi:universal stress protein [Tumebacillus lipolyticus]|uniref:Universal stress protein n=1 Tax=Tumebacillus lipolyticus TaxID=1280370 RepID=A0ABW4ZXA3_9BACL
MKQAERKTPEQLLDAIERQSRGHFKILIGAAPGVGKTYAMLREGNELLRKGADVVIGLIETHGRVETERQIGELPIIELSAIEYKGKVLYELNVAKILERRPQTVLIDELAHTNAPSSKHRKRYEDVLEILAAGIDVISAMNIQHLESLHDMVEQLTGVKVGERVPDRMLHVADEVQLIDTSPEKLRERLRAGLIYKQDKIEQSLNHFFRLGNLNALREVALREVADDVDDRLEHYKQENGIDGMKGANEKILVCVNYRKNAERLIRRGWRIANRLKCSLDVLNVPLVPISELDEQNRKKLSGLEQLCASLGADLHIRPIGGKRPADVITDFVRAHGITQIILGQSARSRFEEITKGSIINKIMKNTRYVDVLIVADGVEGRD